MISGLVRINIIRLQSEAPVNMPPPIPAQPAQVGTFIFGDLPTGAVIFGHLDPGSNMKKKF
jgi:hypothetical protein